MTNWKNLLEYQPMKDCNICVKVGDNFETYHFKRYSDIGWAIFKQARQIDLRRIPTNAVYINLDEI